MNSFNCTAAIVAGVIGFFPGALWYSPLLFLKPWAAEMGIDLANPDLEKKKHFPRQIIAGLIASVAAAIVFAMILGPSPLFQTALLLAVACSLGMVGTSFAIQNIFEGRSLRFWAINTSYHLAQFLIFAVVLALWP